MSRQTVSRRTEEDRARAMNVIGWFEVVRTFITRAEDLGENCPWCGEKMHQHWENDQCELVRFAKKHGVK